jgi:dTDP-4-amino-4,6-dideoxygalactose transaminase
VELFEAELAAYLHVPFVVAVSSGTAALHLACLVQRMHNVASTVPATTFVATGNVIKYLHKDLSIVDVDPKTWTARCSIPADLFGVSANQSPVYWSDPFVEDACQALGSEKIPYAEVACFSFFANKIVTTGGEGGAVACHDFDTADKIRLLRQQGKDYSMEKHAMLGFNYRMTEMQAKYGLRELKDLPNRVERKRRINSQYRNLLPSFKFQEDPSGGSNWWMTSLVLKNRDEVQRQLRDHRVESKKVNCSLAEYRWLWETDTRPDTPVADWLAEHGLSLPSHHSLKPEQVEYVAKLINKFGEPCEYD